MVPVLAGLCRIALYAVFCAVLESVQYSVQSLRLCSLLCRILVILVLVLVQGSHSNLSSHLLPVDLVL